MHEIDRIRKVAQGIEPPLVARGFEYPRQAEREAEHPGPKVGRIESRIGYCRLMGLGCWQKTA